MKRVSISCAFSMILVSCATYTSPRDLMVFDYVLEIRGIVRSFNINNGDVKIKHSITGEKYILEGYVYSEQKKYEIEELIKGVGWIQNIQNNIVVTEEVSH